MKVQFLSLWLFCRSRYLDVTDLTFCIFPNYRLFTSHRYPEKDVDNSPLNILNPMQPVIGIKPETE